MSREFASMKQIAEDFNTGKTKLYELLRQNKIHAVKLGTRTLIEVASVRSYLASLPSFNAAGGEE